MKPKLLIAVGAAVVVIGGLGGTAVAANNAVPGDVLYPLDTAVESIGRFFTGGSDAFEDARLREREEEYNTVKNSGDEDQLRTAEQNLEQQRARVGDGSGDGEEEQEQNQNQNQGQNDDSESEQEQNRNVVIDDGD